MKRFVAQRGIYRLDYAFRSLTLLVALLCFASASADTITVTSVADADIEQFHADVNHGSDPSMASGKLGTSANGEIRRALVKFDLSQIPSGATISDASLSVSVVNVPQNPISSNFDIRRLLKDWDEGSVTWNSTSFSASWDTPGADGPTDSAALASSSVFVSGLGTYTFPGFDTMLADIQNWVADPTSNFGWLLASEDETHPFTARRFAARESFVNVPTLTVTYFLPVAIQTQPQSQTVFAGRTVTFSVSATGSGTLAYQWFFNSNSIPGATNSVLMLTNVQPANSGTYAVVVSDQNGSVTSQPATLTVSILPIPEVTIVPPPTNGQRLPTGSEFTATASAFETNGAIVGMELLLDTNVLATTTNATITAAVTNLTAGQHLLAALATDSLGTTASNQVSFLVLNPLSISITRPLAGSTFPLGTNVSIAATSSNSGTANFATITNVSIFANGELIGQHQGVPFNFAWSPAQADSYLLTAVAEDEFSESITSAPVVIRVFTPETTPPKLHITRSPPNFTRLREALVTLEGTASDNVGVDRILYRVNDTPARPATGTSSWTATVSLAPGINTIRVWAIDLAGNTNLPATRFYTYVVKAPLTLQTTGDGRIIPNVNGRVLELGKPFTVRAQPSPGSIFAGWSGTTNTNSALLRFVMSSNLTLTANFIPNPFVGVSGSYVGLFFNTNDVEPETSGLISVQVTSLGAFTGKLNMNGKRYPFHGRFDVSGQTSLAVLRAGFKPTVLRLNLGLSGPTNQLSGYVSNAEGTAVIASPFAADRNEFKLPSNPAPQHGLHSFSFIEAAQGTTIAKGGLAVTGSGVAWFRGKLQNGSDFVVVSAVDADGTLPFYLGSSPSEMILGSVELASHGTLSGALLWVRSGSGGFTRQLNVGP